MNRILHRILAVIGVSGMSFAAVETAANAGVNFGNHCEPVARDHR